MQVLQMNQTSPVSSLFLKYKYQFILIYSVIWLGMIGLKYNSFDTDMGIQMM